MTRSEEEEAIVNINSFNDNIENIEYEPYRDITEFPGYSKYEDRCLLCCKAHYIPALKSYFIGHWMFMPVFPFFVYFLAVTAFLVILVIGLDLLELVEIVPVLVILFILGFLFLYNYTRTIVDGPGYYPFSYVHDNGKPPDIWSGIQSNDEQYNWVQLQDRPLRAAFFRSAHRYVIRPDHFCDWAGTWIGKRNYKFFFLFNFYGMFYLSFFTVYMIRCLLILLVPFKFSVHLVFILIYTLLGMSFTVLTGNFFFTALFHALKNTTSWEIWNDIDTSQFNRNNWRENLEDALGEGNMCLWFCPFSPWINMTNEEISAGYVAYDDC
ncbi:DHHC zinc finger domain containing protein [Tritrichomonas foetus]|uniref:Palmitoyltransferase n=1 Tax=Tritrichomonas foetus TaxID=1144522 RepID=A0A1J4JMH6_9EUKA|nr:DHHC zinc finger domain containing protein [Tritrichomonas foetus]|eukprot:OHS98739.1 DHHC zinc finger domain containing protein [Tritrichomonas foetus]